MGGIPTVAADVVSTVPNEKPAGMSPLPPRVRGDAEFSADLRYRYWLERRWQDSLPHFTYILLNPSRAGGWWDDRTSHKLHSITKTNGGGGFELVNLFATVDTKQVGLHLPQAVEHAAGENDLRLRAAIERSGRLIVGWGDGSGTAPHATQRKAAILRRASSIWPTIRYRELWCVGTNGGTGAPRHPGQGTAKDVELVRYIPTGRYP
jgi:hypothetical protein